MPFQVIEGTFKPATGQPDGDSCRFAPDNQDLVYRLRRAGSSPKFNSNNGTIGLRYEGIDALEKAAKEPFASNATKRNLELLNIGNGNDESRGFLLAKQLGPYGRIIAFIFNSDVEVPNETAFSYYLNNEMLKKSVNYKLINQGYVYPLFYDTLYYDLRNELVDATIDARNQNLNIWKEDKSNEGIVWGGRDSLAELPPIFPKLWRRLSKYTSNSHYGGESDSLENFKEYLETVNDRVLIQPINHFTSFVNLLEIDANSNRLKMLHQPEELVFQH